jgi:hypothetical protein
MGPIYRCSIAALLAIASTISVSGVGAGENRETAELVDEWFLVRLSSPIAPGTPSSRTGFPEVDSMILEHSILRIENALPVSTRQPRDPEALRRHGLDRTYVFHVVGGADVLALAGEFSALHDVEFAEAVYRGGIASTIPDDPRFPDQWSLDQVSNADVNAPEAWDTAVGSEVIVAVVDTGVDPTHPDLQGLRVAGYDFQNDDDDPSDDHGHGTFVASIILAQTDNGTGMAGACWNCRLMPLKVWNASGTGTPATSADAIVWATDNGAGIINYSGGYVIGAQVLHDAVRYAHDAGVILVSITHNQNSANLHYPARWPETIAVGASDAQDRRAVPFSCDGTGGSNYGAEIDVVAPGDSILGALLGGGYGDGCGTSFAAPIVSGLLGIVETVYPSVGREEARHLIRSAADDQVGDLTEDTPGFDVYKGWGRVDMDETVRGAESSIRLRVDGKTSTRPFFQIPNPLADSYDFIRGDLGALTETAQGVDLGSVICLEDDSPDPDTLGNEDAVDPAPGRGFFYLARTSAAPGEGSYGGSSRNRDRTAALGDCATAAQYSADVTTDDAGDPHAEKRYDCSPRNVDCPDAHRECGDSSFRSVENGCWGDCVDFLECTPISCRDHGDCQPGMGCNPETGFCQPKISSCSGPIYCNIAPPRCPSGYVPTVAGGCWGPCVAECYCRSNSDLCEECPFDVPETVGALVCPN